MRQRLFRQASQLGFDAARTSNEDEEDVKDKAEASLKTRLSREAGVLHRMRSERRRRRLRRITRR